MPRHLIQAGACALLSTAAALPVAASAAARLSPQPTSTTLVRLELKQAAHDPVLAARLLRQAIIVSGDSRATVVADAASFGPGCHSGTISDRHTIELLGITFGWQEVDLHGFCWSGAAIIWTGGASFRRYSAFPYCWTNTNAWYGWAWWPTWQQAWAYGQLGGNTGFGGIGWQSDTPVITIANGGGIWRR